MILLIPITAVLLSWIWFDVWRMPERFELCKRKPLNCVMCFSMWMGLIIYFCPVFIQELLFVTSTAAAIGAWADQKK